MIKNLIHLVFFNVLWSYKYIHILFDRISRVQNIVKSLIN